MGINDTVVTHLNAKIPFIAIGMWYVSNPRCIGRVIDITFLSLAETKLTWPKSTDKKNISCIYRFASLNNTYQ